jgi:hypothetical protein
MEKLTNKKALVGLGVLGVAGIAGAAFAASVSLDPSNAGQGADVVDGFTVTNIEYDGDATGATENVSVTEVEFDIARDSQTLAVDDDNASVFVQLRDGSTRSDWVECETTAGHSICDTSASGATILIEDIDGISVVAYDDLD